MSASSASQSNSDAGNAPRLIIRTCAHILPHGVLCRAPAVRDQPYCRHHRELRARRLRMVRAARRMRVRVPLLYDMESVQLAHARVRYAVSTGRMSEADARLFRFALRLAASNLRFMERQQREQEEWEAYLREMGDSP